MHPAEIRPPALPTYIATFLENRTAEINALTRTQMDDWESVGYGIAKMVFEHSDLPGWVVKVPLPNCASCEQNMRDNYANLNNVRHAATFFDQIVLPESYLYETRSGVIAIEQKLEIVVISHLTAQHASALQEFSDFQAITSLSDLHPLQG